MCQHFNYQQKLVDWFLYGKKLTRRCPECRHEIYKKHYESNKQRILEKAALYRKQNPEKVKKIKAEGYQKWRRRQQLSIEYEE